MQVDTAKQFGDGGRVLVVDDDPAVASLTREYLNREAAVSHVVVETDARAALDVVDADPELDVVVCDFHMPRLTGIELFEAVRQRRPSLSFVLFTGSAEHLLDESAAEAVDALVIKDGERGRYDQLVSEVLETLAVDDSDESRQ